VRGLSGSRSRGVFIALWLVRLTVLALTSLKLLRDYSSRSLRCWSYVKAMKFSCALDGCILLQNFAWGYAGA